MKDRTVVEPVSTRARETASFGGVDPSLPKRRDMQMALLRDCAVIAEWDAAAAPRGVDLDPETDAPTRDDDDPDEVERVKRRRERLARGASLRSRLTALWMRDKRAAAVIEWLVPRARVMLDSVTGPEALPVQRAVTAAVARAFTTPRQWMRWHPPPPPEKAKPIVKQAYRVAADAGVAGVQRHGGGLLALAELAWFGTTA